MKIAVLSDIHDNIWNLERALKRVKKEKCKAIIFCGDFVSPFVVSQLVETKIPIWGVFGNNEGDRYSIAEVEYKNLDKLHLYDRGLFEFELGGKKFAVHHYELTALYAAQTGKYDAVFYGHTHQVKVKNVGKTLLANPGEIMGKNGKCTFGIYDTKTERFKIIEFE
jgi:putative phosphoesterase